MFERFFPQLAGKLRATATRAVFGAIAAVLAVVAAGFLIGALFIFLAEAWGELAASLVLGGAFLILAALVWVAGSAKAHRQERRPIAAAAAEKAAASEASATPHATSMMVNMAEGLARTGFRREGLALRAAAEATRSLKPSHYAALSVLAAFVLGRRFLRGRAWGRAD